MKKGRRVTAISIFAICFFSFVCGCNNGTKVDLGEGYFYVPPQDAFFNQSGFDGNGIYMYVDSFIFPVIYPNIIRYQYNSFYVIIKQKFDFTETRILLRSLIFHPIYFNYYKNYVPLDENYVTNAPVFNDGGLEEKYVDSIMHIDSHIKKMMAHKENYYIIDKMKHKVMGPFTKAELNERREALHISDSLKLE